MWSTKKFIIAMVLAAVLAIVSVGGIVLAQDNGDKSVNQPDSQYSALLERVCEIYAVNTDDDIDPEALKVAIAQARSEVQAAAMEAHLAKMVENGVIDETQAQELKDWWESRPEDLPFGPGLMARGGGGPFGEPGGGFHGGDRLPSCPQSN
jgi:hypothetical protein